MASQLDLDQGGTFRQYQKIWMGPSVGWQTMPVQAILNLTAAGTYPILRWTNLIKCNVVAGVVNIDLPSSLASAAGPQAIPGQWIYNPVVIVDLSGQAGDATTINIFPFGSELIAGLNEIQLTGAYGAYVLEPLLDTGGWTMVQ